MHKIVRFAFFSISTCPRKIADFETIAHDRPDDCLQCDWLPFPCAIRVNRRTAAAAE